MADYSDFIALAKELIDENGEQIVIRKITLNAGAKAWRPNPSNYTDIPATGVFFPNAGIRNPHTRQLRRKIDVPESALMGYIPATYLKPFGLRVDISDIIIKNDGSLWKVTSVDDMAVDSLQPIYYEVRLSS